jgi:hypothetical protein
MQFIWPNGQTGCMQGLHSMGTRTMRLVGLNGLVVVELVEPKMATRGVFSAAAMCIRPESLVTKASHRSINAMASPRRVRPLRSMAGPVIMPVMDRPSSTSDGPPK